MKDKIKVINNFTVVRDGADFKLFVSFAEIDIGVYRQVTFEK